MRVVAFYDNFNKAKDFKMIEEEFFDIYRSTYKEGKEKVIRENMQAHGYRRDLRHE